ncbi:unnamed protein product [Onchocerca flexuosa]|uniref:NOT2_3_5 domain-containing protein n=1 Tax=Onchocerca flexuosa TaxID=387005 RepID=A0A183I588_9BILA|nr:unnamed protein product [Onchocerca flexuosa]
MKEESKQPPKKIEFQMRNEDFPPLPTISSFSSERSKIMISTGKFPLQMNNSRVGYAPKSAPNFFGSFQPKTRINIQTYPAGTVTNIPPNMMTDQFGMLGFLAAYRGMRFNPNIASIIIGEKAELLGLGMNSKLEVPNPSGHGRSEIHLTYGGPWANNFSNHAPHIDAKIPEKFKTNALIREKLAKIKFPLLEEDVLFYLFYNYPGEEYQIAAAHELHVRDWRYNKVERKWLRRLNFGSVIQQTAVFERGTYNVFDPENWKRVPRDMIVEYKDLEEQPELPPNMKVFFEP